VLASTNRSVSELQRHFRPDFYGRLVQVCIAVPSLAERWAGESAEVIEHDLSQMFEFVIERMNFENRRRRHIGLERSAVRLVRQLVDEHIEGTDNFFDGNIRMLRNIIERAYEGAQYDNSSVVGLGHVMTTLGAARMMQVGAAAAGPVEPLPSLEQVVGTLNFDVIRRRAIDEALARTQGNQIKAAELLGIHRDTLRRWLQGPEEPDQT
jgi:DNA-binding NtrC family response regulator